MTTEQTHETGICGDCGSTEEVQDGLCDTCYTNNYVWCGVCSEMIDYETALYRHRHLYYSERHGAWLGPGGAEMSPGYARDIRRSLCVILDKVPYLAALLAASLERGDFYAQLRGSCFGAESICFHFGYQLAFGDQLMQGLTEALEEVMAEGICWLLCFYKEEMPEARAQTVGWIRDWRTEHLTTIRLSRRLFVQSLRDS